MMRLFSWTGFSNYNDRTVIVRLVLLPPNGFSQFGEQFIKEFRERSPRVRQQLRPALDERLWFG